jgi:hypothetical protein
MNLKERLTRERLNFVLTEPNFLKDVSKIVDKSQEKGLVGRFGFYYDFGKNRFYVSDVVSFYKESDLETEMLDYEDSFHLDGARFKTLWPRIGCSQEPYVGDLVAQIYTIPKDYDEPVVRAFNLGDLGVARVYLRCLQSFCREEINFRPFGVVVDKYHDKDQKNKDNLDITSKDEMSLMTFNFYSELMSEPYLARVKRENRMPKFEEIAEAGNLISPINLFMALFNLNPEPEKTHSFNRSSFIYKDGKFRGNIDSDVLDDLVLWDFF